MSPGDKKTRPRGNLSSFLVSTAEHTTLPRLGVGLYPTKSPPRLTKRSSDLPSKIRSISSSISFDLCKERILPPRDQAERYFLNNVITPSESQKIVQLVEGQDFGIQHHVQTHTHSHSHAELDLNPTSSFSSHHQQSAASLASSSSRGRVRSPNGPSRTAFVSNPRTTAAEAKRYEDVEKYALYSRLNRSLLHDVFNGTDDNSAVFLHITTRQKKSLLDSRAQYLEGLTEDKFVIPGNHQAVVGRIAHRMKQISDRTEQYRKTIRGNTAEARSRNKAFIDLTLAKHANERSLYGSCETEEEDVAGDQEFLAHVQRSRTASAAILRRGFSSNVFPFVIQEFINTLHSDGGREVTFSSSTALIDPCAPRALTLSSTRSGVARAERATHSQDDAASGGSDLDDEWDGPAAAAAAAASTSSAISTHSADVDGEANVDGEADDTSVISLDDNRITSINLRNWGLADARAACLAVALPSCPLLRHLDISGNRLTDASCAPILHALLNDCPGLQYLNLSDNKLDDRSIEPLRSKLASPECTIESLHLAKSDVDDDECAKFMLSMGSNRSVRMLNLSHNKIGEMEEHLTVFPSFITGGMAIAAVFSQNNTLTELNLSWNQIRKESAIVLVKSFADNHTLRILNLSYNNIGDRACQYMGHAMRTNKVCLSMLNLACRYKAEFTKMIYNNRNHNKIGSHSPGSVL